MRVLLILLSKELKSIFWSPVAYAVLTIFLLIGGAAFNGAVAFLSVEPSETTVLQAFFLFGLFWFAFLPVFPLLTMRLFSEEYKLGTMETLLTAPVRDWQVVAAKFLSAVGFYLLLILPLFAYFYIFYWVTGQRAVDSNAAYLGTFLILMLCGMFYIALGCLASALTRNQIVAAILGFALVAAFFFCGLYAHISVEISSRVFYLSSTIFVLGLTLHVFQYRKWRS
jgi:ABC-2 type transport system permease protein